MNSSRRFREGFDDEIVSVRHPHRRSGGIPKEQCLVTIVLLDSGIPIEVIRRKIGEDADARIDAWRVVKLKRRDLERDPIWRRGF